MIFSAYFSFFFSQINEPSNDTNTICYVLLIASFILTWVETWFLDFKVLPREQKDRERGELPMLEIRIHDVHYEAQSVIIFYAGGSCRSAIL